MVQIEFASLDAARQIRTNPKYAGFLSPEDHGGRKAVTLKDNTPAPAVDEITAEAADGRSERAEQYGQASVTEAERGRIDFTRTNVLAARSAKAIALGKGVDDWTAYFDPELTVDEHRGVYESAVTEGGGDYGGRDLDDEREIDRRLAQASYERKSGELDRAKDYGFGGDREAQEFVRSQGSLSKTFDIGFDRDGDGWLTGSGEDFNALEEIHDSRSQRAQTLDEITQAPMTRDPFEWSNAPDRWDFPALDTVQLGKLHAERSSAARAQDEREFAPLADTKQKWAHDPDRYDWRGVDTPVNYGATMDTPIPAEERRFSEDLLGTGLALEDFENESWSESQDSGDVGFGLAGGLEADEAFVWAEQSRGCSPMEEFGLVDDRDRQGSLAGFGMETDGSVYRESRTDVETASEFGIDDRASVGFGDSFDDIDEGVQESFDFFDGENSHQTDDGLDEFF